MDSHARQLDHSGGHGGGSLNAVAALATLHCLTGCAIGEVLGMVIGTSLGWSNAATIALAVLLAFVFGYGLTILPLVRAGLALGVALPVAFAADSFSIAVMELVDNGVMLAVPGAMDAPLSNPLFWGALAFALAVAYVVAFPVNRYLIARGRGHAVVHGYHGGGGETGGSIGSPRKLIAFGLAAMTLTIGIATAGAVVVESRHDEEPAMDDHDAGTGSSRHDRNSTAGG